MSAIVDLSGLDRILARVRRIEHPNVELLMATWQDLIVNDNRKGVLAGLDKDGQPMRPVTYRPKGPTVGIKAKSAARFRNNQAANRRGAFLGFGPHASGLHNNLTTGEYEQLTGPPLAPRGAFSRVITNLVPGSEEPPAGTSVWTAYAAWIDVVTTKGVPFLPFAFRTRDLRGVRPEGRLKARRAAVAWMSDQIRIQPTGTFSQAG
jgi:hypothetical protein